MTPHADVKGPRTIALVHTATVATQSSDESWETHGPLDFVPRIQRCRTTGKLPQGNSKFRDCFPFQSHVVTYSVQNHTLFDRLFAPYRPTIAMSSIDSQADFKALLSELQIHEKVQEWLQKAGFLTISDLVYTFMTSTDGEAFLQKIPNEVWVAMGLDPTNDDVFTSVMAGKLRRLLAQCRLQVSTLVPADTSALTSTLATPVASPLWNELAPPRLTPEAVAQMVEKFGKNYPGELLTPESTPSIRLLSVVHHSLKPGQSLKYIPWQIRLSQKQYQEMTEAKTHKAIRSEAQLLGALLDETPELPVENMKLSAEWLSKTQQVFRNAFVICGAAHLQVFKKFDDRFFHLAMKKHSPESMLRSVDLAELLEADKYIWNEITGLLAQKWSLNEALRELTAIRADLYGVLQPRPKPPSPPAPRQPGPPKPPKVKKQHVKGASKGQGDQDLCTFTYVNGTKQSICQRFQKGTCTSRNCKYAHVCAVKIQGKPCGQKHGAHAHGNKTWSQPEEASPGFPAPQEGQETQQVQYPISPPPGCFALTTSGRFFLDLFSGRNAPIHNACKILNVDLIHPLDVELGWNILDDNNFERILHTAWNGFLGGVWSAPPCREYSRLKLRPGGPPALRTPEEPYGRSDLSSQQQLQLQEQEFIHDRGRQILTAAFSRGALVGWETPTSAMTLLLTENTDMLRDWNATCAYVAACHWGMQLPKSWLLCSNDIAIESLAGKCTCPLGHPSFAGKRTSTGTFVSAETAEYPPSLAMAIAQIMSRKCTFNGVEINWNQPLLRPTEKPTKKHINDGGGIPSSAEWTVPHKRDIFHGLRAILLEYGKEHGLINRVSEHLQQGLPEAPLSREELNPLKQLMHNWAHQHGLHLDWTISPGQNFRLFILETFAKWIQDPDLALYHFLQQGVPTGVLQPIPPSHIWPPKSSSTSETADSLHSFTDNWKGAMDDPNLTWDLISEEIRQGWVKEIPGGLEEAKQRWTSIAVGKLNVVHSEGRKPRLVLDSSCCNVNQKCKLPETMILPTVDDVRASFDMTEIGESIMALSLDIQAAHKQVRLAPSDQGLVMFAFQGRYFHYKVAHFGGKFSAFWWSRVGAFLIRLLHQLLGQGHKAFIYVDDLLLIAPSTQIAHITWLTTVFLLLLGTPISWKKAQLGFHISWIGWHFNFQFMTVQLLEEKSQKLLRRLKQVITAKRVPPKQLEQLLGMLIWFTAIAKHLRPHLAPIYKCLYDAPATLFSIPAASWPAFVNSLDELAVLIKPHPHCILPLGGRVIEMGHQPIQDRHDLPLAPKTSKLQWVRIACPFQSDIQLTKEAKAKIKWFQAIIERSTHVFPIPRPLPTVMRAAADAYAEDQQFGIGGWLITSSQVSWFSIQLSLEDIHPFLPGLSKDAQKYIASFEILAQLVLLMMASEVLVCDQMELCIPSSSDNTAAEASINRSMSSRYPASEFLQLISQLAWQQNIGLQITHIPGVDNRWADDLSRDNLKQWQHYPRYHTTVDKIFSIGRVIRLAPDGPHEPWLETLTRPLT